ncbi:uncharacterized protein LOC125490391 [Plutella xylostella]|uniref:uncharacterized protein LOC125490391 n=1 Tax=Plutella xylostella TaxID=51655 RepID=UPI002032DA20|nr:uncharacterized protein LOC125490391 [Plutella xylostella]
MPTFDGSFERWLEFRDTFSSLVHNSTDITNIQKFHYLKSSLKGSAALIIDALEFSSDNYNVAWELLLNRYNNNRLLVQNHIKALFNLNPLPKESAALIRTLIDTILKNLRALNMLGEPTQHWDTLVVYMIVSKLDKTTEREWEQYKGSLLAQKDSKIPIKVDDIIKFLEDRADMLETLHLSHSKESLDHKKQSAPKTYNSSHCNVSTNNNKPQDRSNSITSRPKKLCLMCNANHPIYSCQKFLDISLDSKLKLIAENKLCRNCLRSGHAVDDCRFGPCKRCNKKHNSIIHVDDSPSSQSVVTIHAVTEKSVPLRFQESADRVNDPSTVTSFTTCAVPFSDTETNHSSHSQIQAHNAHTHTQAVKPVLAQPVLLSTALVEVADVHGRLHTARALLDSGSQRCFITKSFCELLGAQLIQSTHEIRGVGDSVTQCTQTCVIDIKSHVNTYTKTIQCYVLPKITSTMPPVCELSAQQFCIPDHIQLADPTFLDSKQIDILIGADQFWNLLCDGKIRLRKGPYLQSTKLGWIISGPIYNNNNNHNSRDDTRRVHCHFTQTIETQLRKFWEIEEASTISDKRTDEERACEEHFVRTTTRAADGRFCVRIPHKLSPDTLGESYSQAERRFLALERRLQRSAEYKQLYSNFIHEYEDLGHMSRVEAPGSPHYFLPHHGVLRPGSSSSPLRTVFDGSAATSTGVSLNDIQMVGPPIQGDLIDIMLRFRQYRYVACADIAKMYRQCLVAEDQRDLQLILWRDEPTQPISIYKLRTVTYGLASSAFLSIRCLKQLAVESTDPDVQRVINCDFYVDDMVTGLDDKNDLLKLCTNVSNTLQSGCFPLRKWIYNFVPDDSSYDQQSDYKSFNDNNNDNHRTLGIGWSPISDEFHFNTNYKNNENSITKRTILSSVSQIFDPLGFLSPTIMQAKVLLQRLWLLKISWDDELPNDVTQVWVRFVSSLPILDKIRIPRHAIGINPKFIECHVFVDASQSAYGTCIYLRTISADNDNTPHSVTMRLLCSKGRVAPIKPVSIPRLELCGALLGARLYTKVRDSLRCEFSNVVFWTDSTIVLGWLKMAPNLLKTFVQNRTAEIHDLTKDLPWRHVSGKKNPADLVSRGVGLGDLSTSSLWWEGPEFLHDVNFNHEQVPIHAEVPTSTELPELKSNTVSLVAEDNSESFVFPFTRFSQYNRIKHTVAYMLRFIHNARNKNKHNRRTGAVTVCELKEAENKLIKLCQLESFPQEYKALSANGSLKNKHNLSKLNLFIDKDGLIRILGRLENAPDLDYDKKHPVLISGKHYFALLLFRYEHRRLLHSAQQALLFNIRESWWPIGGRNLARKVLHDCVTCRRIRGKTLTPLMGNLPIQRITPSYPFNRCGVDYAGPVLVLNRKGRGAKTTKAYICLFVCLATRAIHLELASDLSTESYLLCLKRLISRRGKVSEIFSDNGRNFLGLKNDFAKFLSQCSDEIKSYATSENIKFSFIPPFSPHFGGLWEGGVKSCKYHLRRVVGNAHLTYEEFSTVLTQIEAVLNSRPLTPMSADPDDLTPLSPGHFLIGRPLTAPACPDYSATPTHRLSRYQRLEQIRQQFWSRWAKEYVSELQVRVKWWQNNTDLQPNTLVVIKDDNLPPLKWQMGRVEKTFPGKDGISRVADIRTSSGILRRPYTKICPLSADGHDT